MDRYWLRIIAGALAIFGVGMGITYGVRQGKRRIENVVNSSDPITIPLAGIVPFTFDGHALGRVRSLTIERKSPKEMEGVRVSVRLADSLSAAAIPACDLYLDHIDIDEKTTFACAPDGASGDAKFARFGEVNFGDRENGGSRALFGDSGAVAKFRRSKLFDESGNGAQVNVSSAAGGSDVSAVDGTDRVSVQADSAGVHIVVKDADGDNANIRIGPKGVVVEGSGVSDALDSVAVQYAAVRMQADQARRRGDRRLAAKLDETADRLKQVMGKVAAAN